MNKKLYLGAAVLGLFVTTGLVAGISQASQGEFFNKNKAEKSRMNMHSLSEHETYADFLASVGEDSKLAEKITEEKFNEMLEMKALKESGDFKGFGELKKSCQGAENGGCPFSKLKKEGFHGAGRMSEEARTALETGTYEEWLAVAGEECKIAEKVNADNFAQFQEMHTLKKEGKIEECYDREG